MRFQLSIKMNPGHDMENIVVTFNARIWADAARWADKFRIQLGIDHSECKTEIVYASKTEASIRAGSLHTVEGAF